MSYSFGTRSMANLNTCDHKLQALFHKVIQFQDCAIIEGHRNEADQQRMFETRKSKLQWPHSKHNTSPSRAVDVIPWPFEKEDWQNISKFCFFAGMVMATGKAMGIELIWGGDWDGNLNPYDNWIDAVHYELRDEA